MSIKVWNVKHMDNGFIGRRVGGMMAIQSNDLNDIYNDHHLICLGKNNKRTKEREIIF